MHRLMWLVLLSLSSAALLAESAAGVRWTAPPGWTSQGREPMRVASYTIAPAPGDKVGAECGVYFFGAGQGGSLDANVERWKSQFRGPGGSPAGAKVAKRTVHGLLVTTIDVSGDYSGLGGPTASASRSVASYRLLGAIIEAPGGNVFIKVTGPAKTIAANQKQFEQLLASLQPDK